MNGTAVMAKPRKITGGCIAIHEFCSNGLRPLPSEGIKEGVCKKTGSLGNSFINNLKGEAPIVKLPILTPEIMIKRKNCIPVKTRKPNLFWLFIFLNTNKPTMQLKNIQSKKLPS